jgi:hypothetical protein
MHPDTHGAAKQIIFQKTTKTVPRNTVYYHKNNWISVMQQQEWYVILKLNRNK